jgi:glyoxylase-like metal-dependent hydrolase (beta-lactamase superfamily II)
MSVPQSGVYQIPDLGFSNAYVAELEGQSLAVIDTGTPGKERKVLDYIATLGRKPADVSYIILTHPDSDHSGSAAALKRLTGAKLAIGELDAPRLSGEKKLKEASGFGGFLVGLFGSIMKVERVKPDIELKDGSIVGPLTIVDTPGHTDGSISVYKPGAAMFVGDLLQTDSSGKLKLAPASMSRDMEQVKRSADRISKLEFQQLLPGHGKPIQEGASKALRDFVANGFR